MPGNDDVRPGGELALEHRGREDEAGAPGELCDARVGGGLVARDDERADLALLGRVGAAFAGLVARPSATPRPFGVRGRA